jgi:methionine-rich copper-binding protein CopC
MTEDIGRAAAGLALLLLPLSSAAAEPVHVVEFRTLAAGPNAQYIVRFDREVDHERSRLSVTQGDHVMETLRPILRAEPNVLAASAPLLKPGTYELRWTVRSVRGDEVSEGSMSFTVR